MNCIFSQWLWATLGISAFAEERQVKNISNKLVTMHYFIEIELAE